MVRKKPTDTRAGTVWHCCTITGSCCSSSKELLTARGTGGGGDNERREMISCRDEVAPLISLAANKAEQALWGEQAAPGQSPPAPLWLQHHPPQLVPMGSPHFCGHTGWTSSGDLSEPPSAFPLAMGWGSTSGHQNNPTQNTQPAQNPAL